MKKKITRILPIFISFVIAFGIITFAWILQESKVNGITISADGDGVALELKPEGIGYEWGQDLTLNLDGIKLKPCTYDAENTHQFSDENWNYVTGNDSYVRTARVMIRASEACKLYVSKAVVGDIPINVVCDTVEVATDTCLGDLTLPYQTVTLQFYIDGNTVESAGTSEVTVTFRGQKN